MSIGKDLKIKTGWDDASMRQVLQGLNSIIAKVKELGVEMSKIGGSSGQGGLGNLGSNVSSASKNLSGAKNGGLGDMFKSQLNDLQNLGKLGKESLKTLSDSLKQAQQSARTDLSNWERSLDSLIRKHKELQQEGKFATAAMVESKIEQVRGGVRSRQEAASGLDSAGDAVSQASPRTRMQGLGDLLRGGRNFITGGQSMGQFLTTAAEGSNFWSGTSGPLMGMAAQRLGIPVGAGALASGYAATKAAGAMWDLGRMTVGGGVERLGVRTGAERGARWGAEIDKIRAGDMRTVFGLQELMTNPEALGHETGTMARLGEGGDAALGLLKLKVSAKDSSNDWYHTQQMALGGNLLELAQEASQGQSGQRKIRGERYLRENASTRLAYARLGVSMESGANRKNVPGYLATNLQFNPEAGGSRAASLLARGYSTGEDLSAIAASHSMGMGGANSGAIMAANAAGYGGFGNVIGAAATTYGKERALGAAKMAMGGNINKAAGINLGELAYGYDASRGMYEGVGQGFLGAAQNGLGFGGGTQDINMVRVAQAGLSGGDKLSAGVDALGQAQNLMTAIGSNPGGTPQAQDYLSKMSMRELLDASAGKLSESAENYGITPEMAKRQLSGMVGNVAGRFTDTGGTDKASVAARAFQDFRRGGGTDIKEFIKQNPDMRSGFATVLQREGGIAFDEARGAVGLSVGAGSVGKEGGAPGPGKMDKSTEALYKHLADIELKRSSEFAEKMQPIIDGLALAIHAEGGFDSQTSATASLEDFTDAVKSATVVLYRMGGDNAAADALQASIESNKQGKAPGGKKLTKQERDAVNEERALRRS